MFTLLLGEERSPCPEGQYRCDDGSCVDAKRCDGVRECPDSSDEFPGLCGGKCYSDSVAVHVLMS